MAKTKKSDNQLNLLDISTAYPADTKNAIANILCKGPKKVTGNAVTATRSIAGSLQLSNVKKNTAVTTFIIIKSETNGVSQKAESDFISG